jgi:hypothetical protein
MQGSCANDGHFNSFAILHNPNFFNHYYCIKYFKHIMMDMVNKQTNTDKTFLHYSLFICCGFATRTHDDLFSGISFRRRCSSLLGHENAFLVACHLFYSSRHCHKGTALRPLCLSVWEGSITVWRYIYVVKFLLEPNSRQNNKILAYFSPKSHHKQTN